MPTSQASDGTTILAYCQLLQSYLADRQFRVQSGSAHSPWRPVEAGVPQGSVLGPILHVLYTADMPVSPDVSNLVFADDTALLPTSSSFETATRAVQLHSNHIFEWLKQWKIRVNPTKSAHINFTMRHSVDLPLFARGESSHKMGSKISWDYILIAISHGPTTFEPNATYSERRPNPTTGCLVNILHSHWRTRDCSTSLCWSLSGCMVSSFGDETVLPISRRSNNVKM